MSQGVLEDRALREIAAAIREKNGSELTYRPADMAAAIRALEVVGETALDTRLRALVLDDNTMEITYRGDALSQRAGRTVEVALSVNMNGFAQPEARPWHAFRGQIKRVYVDASVAGAGLTNIDYWFAYMPELREIWGMENLGGVVSINYLFSTSRKLETVWATGFDASRVVYETGVFNDNRALVGGADLKVPFYYLGSSCVGYLHPGAGGVFTDPAGVDVREYVSCALYADGEVCVSALGSEEAVAAWGSGRELVDERRLCMNASCSHMLYDFSDASLKAAAVKLTFEPDCAELSSVYADSFCYGWTVLESVVGLSYLGGLVDTRAMFDGCTALAEVDFSGLRAASWKAANVMFRDCTALVRVVLTDVAASALATTYKMFSGCKLLSVLELGGWAPGALTSTSCMFENCKALVDVDLRGFVTSALGDVYRMFYGDSQLRTITVSADWALADGATGEGCFTSCRYLKGGMGTKYAAGNTGVEYCRIDGGEDAPGYLTEG